MNIGAKIRQLRTERSISQEQMAEQLSVSRQAVTKWETGAGAPDIENLAAIARLFGVSTDELLFEGPARDSGDAQPSFESVTVLDLSNPVDFDIQAGCARSILISGTESEKVSVVLRSDTIVDLERAFKVVLDTQGRSFDIDVENTGIVADVIAGKELDVVIELPAAYAESAEIELNAGACTIQNTSMDFELSGHLRHLRLQQVDGHLQIDTSGNLEATATGVTGKLDINQIGATSILHLDEKISFAASTRGRLGRRTLRFTHDGNPVPQPEESSEAPALLVELAGSRVELTIDTVSTAG